MREHYWRQEPDPEGSVKIATGPQRFVVGDSITMPELVLSWWQRLLFRITRWFPWTRGWSPTPRVVYRNFVITKVEPGSTITIDRKLPRTITVE